MRYKDTWLAKGSLLYTLLKEGKKKEAEKLYKCTSADFEKLYGMSSKDWRNDFLSKE